MSILSRWQGKLQSRKNLKTAARKAWRASDNHATAAKVRLREGQVAYASRVVKRHKTVMREKAYQQAVALIGVMEQGGNNRGTRVSQIIRENGGSGPEPWCGDFVAYCYRAAGSTAITRAWASVALLGRVVGVKRTASPQRGDLVRFTFDHVGLYAGKVGNEIETIEGNTGATGAVSDGDGGDGVYRKRRSKALVRDYLRVSR